MSRHLLVPPVRWNPNPAPTDPERIKRVELETALYIAMRSDDPTVVSMRDRLLVAVRLAHGEELAQTRGAIRSASTAMKQEWDEQVEELDAERRNIESEREYNKSMQRLWGAAIAIVVIAVGSFVAIVSG